MEKEWLKEPDELGFEYKGYKCEVKRMKMGHLCGYVTVPSSHPAFGKDYDDLDISCHGGLTYGVVEEKSATYGFDCAHFNDYLPLYEKRGINAGGVYRNIEYVKKECMSIVDQMEKMRKKEEKEKLKQELFILDMKDHLTHEDFKRRSEIMLELRELESHEAK